jgi:hypothetical protein
MSDEFDAFISYRSAERGFVNRQLGDPLRRAGLRVAMDIQTFGFGEQTPDNIRHAIKRSRLTLLALTPSWLKSKWCAFEMNFALELGRALPVILLPTAIPPEIELLHWCDLSDDRFYLDNLSRLISLLTDARNA